MVLAEGKTIRNKPTSATAIVQTAEGIIMSNRQRNACPPVHGCPPRRNRLAPALLAIAMSLAMGHAGAQEVVNETVEPGEKEAVRLVPVVVTAQKRTESVMDVPISITTIDAEEIEAMRITNVQDYIFSVPNATFVNSGSFYGKTVSFRGISQFSGGKYETISVSLDDVGYGAINSNSILSAQFLDIDRIEVLRGPQGTLSGRNSLGGSINIVSAQPDLENYLFKGTLDYSRFNTVLVKAVANAPLADNLALRAVAYGERSDGAIENVGPSGGGSDYKNSGGRIAMRWLPAENLTIDASLGYERQRRGMEDWITGDFTNDALRDAMLGQLATWGGSYPGPVDLFQDEGNNGGKVSKDIEEIANIDSLIGSFKASYQTGKHQFDLIYGHFDYDIDHREDYDTTEYAWWYTERSRHTESDSIEFRVSSDYDGAINWVGGLSYLDEQQTSKAADLIGEWAVLGTVPTIAGNYVPAYLGEGDDRMKSLGLFGNIYWDIGDKWHLSVGGRYSIEKTRYGTNFVFDIGNPDLALGQMELSPEATLREFSPRIAVNYDVGETASVYAQYATGYRAGYSNGAQAISVGAPSDVDPEQVKNYELGYKARFWDNRASVTAAVFYMDYTDLQVQTKILPELNPYPFDITYDINAGSARSRGFELEAQVLATDNLLLSAGIGYTDAMIKNVVLNDVEYRDERIPNVRPWTINATAQYTQSFANGMEALYRADYRWQDEMYWQGVLKDPSYYIPSFSTVDASITFGPQDRRWSVAAYAENLLNEKYFNSVGWVTVGFRGRLVYTPPRTFGLRLNVQFGKPR
jgi:iron complex outermembrane receptor protein